MITSKQLTLLALVGGSLVLGACGDDDSPAPAAPAPQAFRLSFAAQADGKPVDCNTEIAGLGPDGSVRVGLSDLRFYVSNLELWDAAGAKVATTLDENAFQYRNGQDHVTLIDLTGNTDGTCAGTAVAFAEGTARTNAIIAGTTVTEKVKRITFDVGVPQAMMKNVIKGGTVEAAPSPSNEMYWSWATGYRHFVLNVAVTTPGGKGDGYLHVGSRDCGPEGGLALDERERCGFVNTPKVSLDVESFGKDVVAIDLRSIFADLDFKAPIYDPETFEVIGEGTGVECHSSPMQPDCPAIFSRFGVDIATGAAAATSNVLFTIRP